MSRRWSRAEWAAASRATASALGFVGGGIVVRCKVSDMVY